ncbi:type I inositol polyphosphate 5-phosphatase 5 [Malania oleifera]|uniref:type I inositol polyphosphate 5-phosphatase 5 n=1 Tax=Malania oleifera TaxID=397392 RepID=UPI0025ADC908|nr:type I inositol polyphosphate 5-phosphatase 5 [Malania oleifera]
MSLPARRSKSDTATEMTKATSDHHLKHDKKKKSIIPKIFSSKRTGRGSDDNIFGSSDSTDELDEKIASRRNAFSETSPIMKRSFSGFEDELSNLVSELGLGLLGPSLILIVCRIFVATWNVGGKTPNNGLNLEDFLQVEGSSDIYVLGFQEIVPLSAGNVLVIEDNEPAAKWLVLISQALNKPHADDSYCSSDSSHGSRIANSSKELKSQGNNFFQKPSLKVLTKKLRADARILKSCNCPLEGPASEPRRRTRKLSDHLNKVEYVSPPPRRDSSLDDFYALAGVPSSPPSPKEMSYRLIASKQMVGIFVSVWARNELVEHIGHLRLSTVGRGIMGYLGNKGCISISMTLHQTSFCFVCSHLASGEKEGDELKRNADVAEILKSTQFRNICRNPGLQIPERIIDHDRIIWLGDLNYRMALSYEETRILLEDNDWDSLLEKDQLNIEREAGRVFRGWKEGHIMFAPTYKYTHNSDSYAGETVKSKKKRRTPAWCDRILWRGNGIEQLSYIRGESRFSDHRPVCAVFTVEVELRNKATRFRKGYLCASTRSDQYNESIPQRHSFYDLF